MMKWVDSFRDIIFSFGWKVKSFREINRYCLTLPGCTYKPVRKNPSPLSKGKKHESRTQSPRNSCTLACALSRAKAALRPRVHRK